MRVIVSLPLASREANACSGGVPPRTEGSGGACASTVHNMRPNITAPPGSWGRQARTSASASGAGSVRRQPAAQEAAVGGGGVAYLQFRRLDADAAAVMALHRRVQDARRQQRPLDRVG